jgi:hypothetical protein
MVIKFSKYTRVLTFQNLCQELKVAYGSGYLISVRFAESVDLASVSQQLVSTLRALSPGLKVEDILSEKYYLWRLCLTLLSKYTRALTFENVPQGGGLEHSRIPLRSAPD